METSVHNTNAFLDIDTLTEEVTLEPALFDTVGVNTDSSITFFMPDNPTLQFTVKIEATILACEVEVASWDTDAYLIPYNIGTKNWAYKLPEIKQ